MASTYLLRNDHNKPHSLMPDPTSTMYFHNMSCDLWNKILFKPMASTIHERSPSKYLPRCNLLKLVEKPDR